MTSAVHINERDNILSPDYILENVTPRLKHERPARNCACYSFLDLELYFAVSVGPCSYILTDSMIAQEGLTKDMIRMAATRNVQEQIIINSLQDLIYTSPLGESPDCYSDSQCETSELYVATTKSRMYGAAAVFLCTDELARLSAFLDTSRLFLLPSSIHEIIIMREMKGEEESINEMIRTINRDEVAPEERLSDHLYFYDVLENEITF